MSKPKYIIKGETYIGEYRVKYTNPVHYRIVRFYIAKDGHLIRRNAEGRPTHRSEKPLRNLLLTHDKEYFVYLLGMGNEGIYETACELFDFIPGENMKDVAKEKSNVS